MSTSPSLETSPLTSKQEYYSSLPWFRRCLAMLNWRPVVDYELREIEFNRREIEYKQREIAHEQRMQQLQNESEQLRIEDQQRQIAHEQRMKQLESEIAQLDELNSKIDTLLFNSSTSSSPPQNTPDNSED
jgi:TolA-binding protein